VLPEVIGDLCRRCEAAVAELDRSGTP
jgi:hypothetical protein